jgi:hypothetical protein
MLRQTMSCVVLACAFLLAGCHHKVQNPMAGIDSKQPDKTLFDRAMDSMKHGQYQTTRTLLETLINTYPQSEYIARANRSLSTLPAPSWRSAIPGMPKAAPPPGDRLRWSTRTFKHSFPPCRKQRKRN